MGRGYNRAYTTGMQTSDTRKTNRALMDREINSVKRIAISPVTKIVHRIAELGRKGRTTTACGIEFIDNRKGWFSCLERDRKPGVEIDCSSCLKNEH